MAACVMRALPSPLPSSSLLFGDITEDHETSVNRTSHGVGPFGAIGSSDYSFDPVRLAAKQRLAYLIKPQCESAAKLMFDVRRFKRMLLRDEDAVDTVALAARLTEVGYGSVTIRTAIGGGDGGGRGKAGRTRGLACFRNLRHVFLSVSVGGGDDDEGALHFIVDPSFQEHFQISHPTPAYSELLSLLPDEFVGTRGRLLPLVQCLCAEMAASFETRGLALPPWRSAQAMASKWLPQRSRDTAVASPAPAAAPTPAAAAAFASKTAAVASDVIPSSPVARRAPSGLEDFCAERASPNSVSCSSVVAAADSGCSFNRLDDEELLQQVLAKRTNSKGLLSGKLLGGSPTHGGMARTASDSSLAANACAATAGGAAATAAVTVACGGPRVGGCDERSHGGSGYLERQPPVCSGQPHTWRVRVSPAVAQDTQQQEPQGYQQQQQQQLAAHYPGGALQQ